MKTLNLCMILGLLVSCAPSASTVLVGKTPSSITIIDKVGAGIDTTIDNNNKLGEKLQDQKNTISEQKKIISDTLTQADLLKKKIADNQAITTVEINTLIDNFKKVEARNLFMENSNATLILDKDKQSVILVQLQRDLSTTKQQVSDKEHEADNLRSESDVILKENSNLKKKLDAATIKAASASVYQHWIWGIVVGFILWTIAKNIIMAYSPVKFRI